MGDSIESLFDPQATEETAPALATKAIGILVERKIVLPEQNSDCVLGGAGYPPGPAVPKLYEAGKLEGRFWELLTNGVEVKVERWFNIWGTTVLEWIACPRCDTKFRVEGDFSDRCADAVARWLDAKSSSPIICESCAEGSPIEEWKSNPHLGFSMLALQFWNWPPFDSHSWKINIAEMLSEALGHQLVRTWGRI
jgi:hypothetical protein